MRARTMFILIGAAMWSLACGEPTKRAAYEHVATRANPLLFALQPTTGRLQAVDAKRQPHTIVQACRDARAVLWALRSVDLGQISLRPHLESDLILLVAADLTGGWWEFSCGDGEVPGASVSLCARMCTSSWERLAMGVEQLRFCAQQEGVEIASLGGRRARDHRCP